MQVNSSNGSLQQRIFSGTGSIGGVHLPDFNDKYVFSKKKSGISDEEYRKQIVAQAYKDFEKYLSWDMLFKKSYYATARDELEKNKDSMNELEGIGKNL